MRITSKARMQSGQDKIVSKKSFFASRWFIITGVLVLMFVVVAFSRELFRKTQLTNEIDRIAAEINDLRSGNEELSALIEYYQTESYQELSAREHLGLTTPGEVIISIPTNDYKKHIFSRDQSDIQTGDKPWDYHI